MTQPNYEGSDVLDYLQSMFPESDETHLIECQELFRIDLTQVMRNLRKKVGLTQKELAEKLGVTQSWVSKLESANNDHTFESVLAYLAALSADFEATIFLEGNKFASISSQLTTSSTLTNNQPLNEPNPSNFKLLSEEQKNKSQLAQKMVAEKGGLLWDAA